MTLRKLVHLSYPVCATRVNTLSLQRVVMESRSYREKLLRALPDKPPHTHGIISIIIASKSGASHGIMKNVGVHSSNHLRQE